MRKVPKVDLTGKKFNRWTVLAFDESSNYPAWRWLCRCECGCGASVLATNLRYGTSKSCGCLVSDTNSKHHLSGTAIYKAWDGIKQRCFWKGHKSFKHYGGRGITVCPNILSSPLVLLALVGNKPGPEFSLDRKDNNGHYTCGCCAFCKKHDFPANVRWATPKTQARNRRNNVLVTVNSETKSVSEWAEYLRMKPATLNLRIKRGEFGRAFVAPLHERRKFTKSLFDMILP